MIKYYYKYILYKEDWDDYEKDDQEWIRNNKLHREDGPAVECSDGYQLWFVDGECIHDGYEGIINN